jgi:hypothetical protein
MIVNEFYAGQGLGNQLWCHAASRSISERLDVPFSQIGLAHFKGHDFLKLTDGLEYPHNSLDLTSSSEVFREHIFFDEAIDYFSSGYDSRVETLAGKVKLEGLFQSEAYFYNNIDKIAGYFLLDSNITAQNKVESDVCILNVRGGEYKRHSGLILPEIYWKNAILHMKSLVPSVSFVVVTDDRRYAKALFPNYRIISGSVGDCYATIYNAKYIIVSNSSFSYFPIKTSPIEKIVIAPKNWARHNDSKNRWASPANIYKDWLWLDNHGTIHSYDDCIEDCRKLELHYDLNYNIRVKSSFFEKNGFSSMIPSSIKKTVKKLLSYIFPKSIG